LKQSTARFLQVAAGTIEQPEHHGSSFPRKGTRLVFANLGGGHIGALDVGEADSPLDYPKLLVLRGGR
jgi:hypothetical protein